VGWAARDRSLLSKIKVGGSRLVACLSRGKGIGEDIEQKSWPF
jgi:hypothetical protein